MATDIGTTKTRMQRLLDEIIPQNEFPPTDSLKGKKFLQIRKLAHRWDCSTSRIYDLISKGYLRPWHPEKKSGCKGVMVEVRSILIAEEAGFLDVGIENKAAQAGGGDPQPEPNHNT